MPIPFPAFCYITIIYGLNRADMQASQALYTAMLPNRLSLRAQNILPGTNPLTQAAGCTLFLIALEIFIYFPLFCFPFIMIA
jgi:hypothetical protein